MKNSEREPISLVDSLPDYLKPFEKASKFVEIPFPKPKFHNLFDLRAVEETWVCSGCSFRHKGINNSICRAQSKIVFYSDIVIV